MSTPDYRDDLGAPLTPSTGEPVSTGATYTSGSTGSTGSTGGGSGAADQAKQTAGTAADEGKHVAGVAQDEAKKVAGEAKSQLHGLVNQATSQIDDQSRTQRDKLVETIRTFADELQDMASGKSEGNGPAAGLARDLADRAHSLSTRLDGREPRELLDEVRTFARRKPGTFLLGALAAGVVAGRLTRGAKDAQSGAAFSSGTSDYPSGYQPAYAAVPQGGTAAGTPLAGTGSPTGYPVTPEDTNAGLPAPGQSVAADSTWSDTRTTPGGLA
jgi:hypothetical protein